MKKFVSMALAAAMIATMGVTAFAKNDDEIANYGDVVLQRTTGIVGDGYLYIPLRIKGSDIDDPSVDKNRWYYIGDGTQDLDGSVIDMDNIKDFDEMKLKVSITTGKDYVKDCELNEIDDDDFSDFEASATSEPSTSSTKWNGVYAVCIELEDFYEADTLNVKGTAKIQKKTGSTIDDYDFNYKVKNTSSSNVVKVDDDKILSAPSNLQLPGSAASNIMVDGVEVDEDEVTITYPDFEGNVVDFGKGIEMLYMEGEDWNYEVKMSDQGKIALKFDNDSIKSVARAADEDADLTFFNFPGRPKFDFTGTMTITLPDEDEDYYLYQIDEDGDLTKINAKLNDDDDALEFKTRELTTYVLSDMELDTDSKNDDDDDITVDDDDDDDTNAPIEKPGNNTTGGDKNIPSTGSEDFVGVAVALAAVSAAAVGAVTLRRKKD